MKTEIPIMNLFLVLIAAIIVMLVVIAASSLVTGESPFGKFSQVSTGTTGIGESPGGDDCGTGQTGDECSENEDCESCVCSVKGGGVCA